MLEPARSTDNQRIRSEKKSVVSKMQIQNGPPRTLNPVLNCHGYRRLHFGARTGLEQLVQCVGLVRIHTAEDGRCAVLFMKGNHKKGEK